MVTVTGDDHFECQECYGAAIGGIIVIITMTVVGICCCLSLNDKCYLCCTSYCSQGKLLCASIIHFYNTAYSKCIDNKMCSTYLTPNSPAVKNYAAPKIAVDVKSKVAVKKWL